MKRLILTLSLFSSLAFANVPQPAATSRPISVANGAALYRLPNNQSNAVVTLADGRSSFTPKLWTGQNLLIKAAHSPRLIMEASGDWHYEYASTLVISWQDANRWAFSVQDGSSNIEIRDIRVEMPTIDGGFLSANYSKRGADNIRIVRCASSQGNVAWIHGGGSLYFRRFENEGWARKYIFCSFDNQTNHCLVDQTGALNSWRQNPKKTEAAFRLMQQDDFVGIGLNIQGINYKQAAQMRPGGAAADVFRSQKLYKSTIVGGLDVGNIDDPNIHCGVLNLMQLIDCKVDWIHKTKAGGVRLFQVINTAK